MSPRIIASVIRALHTPASDKRRAAHLFGSTCWKIGLFVVSKLQEQNPNDSDVEGYQQSVDSRLAARSVGHFPWTFPLLFYMV